MCSLLPTRATALGCALLIPLCLVSLLGQAHAQEGDARQRQAAAEAYDQGTAAYVARDYEKAAQWFETANRLSPAAPALIQSARSHFKAGNLPRAATLALQLTLAYAQEPAALEVGNALLQETAPALLRVDVMCEGCSLDVDGTLQEQPSFFLPPDVVHKVTASFETGEQSSDVSGAAGETQSLTLEAPPPPPVVVEPEPTSEPEPIESSPSGIQRDSSKKPLPPLVTFIGAGVTGALLIGSILSTVDMYSLADEYKTAANASNRCTGSTSQCAALYEKADELRKGGEPTELRTTILWIATGAAGAATAAIALFLTDWSGDDDSSRAQLQLLPTIDPVRGSAGVRLGARF